MMRSYNELIRLKTFEERFNYLKLNGQVGKETFGFDRWLNQNFYKSYEWQKVRYHIITRDNGCDLGILEHEIPEGYKIFIHHMNPIKIDDIINNTDYLMNPNYLITTIKRTHDALHYGGCIDDIQSSFVERHPNDTCPWR